MSTHPVPRPGPGAAVDIYGQPVIDPTRNVLGYVDAAIKRQDDLREAESRHVREVIAIQSEHSRQMRLAEAARIDAIRSVDVGAVNRAAEVSALQATTLAAQVATSAETLRTQAAATATANQLALQTLTTTFTTTMQQALTPLQEAIAELRQVQYQQQGARATTVETRDTRQQGASQNILLIGIGITAFLALLSMGITIVLAI